MANEENRSVNEVVLNGTTIISTREDSVAEDNLVMDETATNKAGEKIKGELDVASADETYNINDPVDDIADEDYIPFNDVSDSEMPKKKTLFSSFIEKLTKYFLPSSSIGGKSQLKFNDSGVLDLQLNDIDASKTNNNVTSIHYPTTSNVLDKEGRIIMRTEAIVNPNGRIGWKAYVNNYDTNGNRIAQKGMRFYENKLGVMTFEVDDPRAFRKAIDNIDQLGKSLPTGTVIDDYHTDAYTGTYYFADDTTASGITTLPKAICGKLIVTNNGNGGFSQYYIPNHSVELWVRVWWSNAWTSWEDVAREHTYDNGTEIPANADLNTYTTAGVYQCELSATAKTLSNTPYTGDYMYAFKLIVMALRNSTNKMQLFIPYDNYNECIISYRFTNNNGSSWTPWQSTAKVYGETANSRPIVTMMVSASNNKRGLLHFNQVENHLRHNFNDGTSWATEQTLANINDISPSEIGLGYALGTISGSAITATITDFKLRAGVIVSIKINRQMTTACTLNINNTGAKNIKFWNDEDPTFGKYVGGDRITTFIYDGTYYRVISSDRTPNVMAQSYVADTSGNILLEWGYDKNRAQLKHAIGLNKLRWNYYRNSAWRGDLTIADYDDINTIQNYLGSKNILTRPTLYEKTGEISRTANGVAFTYNTDGSIRLIGTSTSSGTTYVHLLNNTYKGNIESFAGQTLTLSGGNSVVKMYAYFKNYVNVTDSGNGATFTVPSDVSSITDWNIAFGFSAGAVIDTTIYPMLRLSFLDSTWETSAPTNKELLHDKGTYVGICTTAADQKDKVASVDSTFALKVGVRIAIKFSNTNSYSSSTSNPVTLNVNGTGAKNIWYNNTHSGAGNTGTYTRIYGVGNRYVFYIYDGTYWVWDSYSCDDNSTNFLRNDTPTTLTASGEPYIKVKSSSIDLTQANNGVESTQYPAYIIQDKNGRDMSRLETVVETNGQIRTFLQVGNYNTTSASHFRAGITMYTNKSQDMWYGLNNPHYFHRELGFGYGTCSTAADQRVKVVSMPRFRLVVGGIIGVKFSNTNTYSATADNKVCLNVNGTGEKPIYYGTGYPTGTHTTAFGYANKVHYYMYDGTNWVWLNHSQDNDGNNRKSFYGTCATAADQQIKVVSLADTNGWELRAGTIVGVRFSNTNTFDSQTSTPIQLNVNNTGAKNIWYNTTHSGAGNTGSNNTIYGVANRVTYFMYDGTYWVWMNYGTEADTTDPRYLGFGYGTCDTAEATTAKVVTLGSYTLRTGGYVTVKFTYAVPANATMNINSRGAKNIWYRGANITANVIRAGDLATFIYDGTRYHLVGIDRDNNLSINYAYTNSAGRPNYLTFDDSDVLVTQLNYVVLGDIVTVSMNLKLNVAKTYSTNTKIIHGFVPPKQNVFCESQGKLFYLVGNTGEFYVRNTSFTAEQTLWGLNFTYIKA